MTTTQMAYFIAMAEKLSFTIVAEMFYVTQPTLSRQIMNIESELDTQLFVRKNNAVTLTPAGKELYKGLKPLYRQYSALVSSVRRTQQKQAVSFDIGLAEELLMDDIVQLSMNILRANHPELNVTIQRASYTALFEGLREGRFSVINTLYNGVDLSLGDLEYLHIADEGAHLAVSRTLKSSFPARLSIPEARDIFSNNRVLLSSPDYFNEPLDDPLAVFVGMYGPFETEPDVVFCGSPISIPIQVTAGLGVTVCNKTNLFAIDPEAAIIEIEGAPAYSKGLFYLKDTKNDLVQEFLAIVREKKMAIG